MSVSFNTIPIDIRTPGQYIEFDNSRAVQGTPAQPHIALIVGQQLATATVAEQTPTLVGSSDAGESYFGVGAQVSEMIRAYKKANPATELWAIGLDDAGAATAGTQTITVTGDATADGVLVLYIAGHRIEAVVTDGDALGDVAATLNAAILAYTDYARLPFTTAVALGVVTLTARNKGTVANGIDVRLNYLQGELTPAGITVAIAAGVAGATDPAMSDAITAMGDVQYHTIISALADATSLTALKAELLTRWGPMEQKEGHAFVGAIGTQSTLTTLGNTHNSQFLTIMSGGGAGGNSPTPTYDIAAIAGAVDSAEPDPARPRQTLVMTGMLPPEPDHRFERTERNILLTDGISTNYVDGGGLVRIERIITTYQTNPLAVADPSYLDVTTLRTLYRLRYDVRTRIALKYPRHKLANDGTLFDPGQAVVTPSSIRAELISLFRSWESSGLVEGGVQFKEDLIVERSSSDVNRVDMRMSPDLMNQFRVFAGQIQFLL